MARWQYTRGLHELGNGCYAWLQPDGTWGWSNAGLVESRGRTLLVDTLMGLRLTQDMLDAMRLKVPAAAHIDKLVNTHANPDHVLGNELVTGAEIISGRRAAEGIAKMDAAGFERMAQNWQQMGDGGEFFHETMGRTFDFAGITIVPPTVTFEGSLTLHIGDKEVRLIDLGPAHTESDTIVYVPGDRTVFTGDLVFNEGTPVMWAGPVQNWIAACDFLVGLDVETVVPGHGPITDKTGVLKQKRYFEYVRDEARKRYDAGVGWEEAARDMTLGEFAAWSDAERIVGNVFALYREFGAPLSSAEERGLFGAMGRWRKRHKHVG
jgi:glyoxylase-like metal-dependent hydrolase (beta-lactamase superfamily II)